MHKNLESIVLSEEDIAKKVKAAAALCLSDMSEPVSIKSYRRPSSTKNLMASRARGNSCTSSKIISDLQLNNCTPNIKDNLLKNRSKSIKSFLKISLTVSETFEKLISIYDSYSFLANSSAR